MFDPTIFDNLKVAFENHVYDLDNLNREIDITNRQDLLDLSLMSREFVIEFELVDQQEVKAEIVLEATLKDLASEILETSGESPGCTLSVRFHMVVEDIEDECELIDEILENIWKPDHRPAQTLRFTYGNAHNEYRNTVEVPFNHKINEDHMDQIPEFIDHVVQTLHELNEL
ncbi:hypothetical protein CR203_08360 [Salipaludibacillus neizhouensis]|uniref:Group-specific protein n=1 Tax=Salipaludibacillus neizhouensis TaxID=885475 RepID=A0A3A9K974_9BACI|nr:hypothetical protein [Salipaludibacillus neizhouensis]RKL67370.1 hypothetical protein CR203_08360 [Salipaludibacillus neizhouensis]